MIEYATVESVLSMIEGQRFYDWHQAKFADYIGGDSKITKEEILNDLKQMLNFEDML